jgi:hypothetical protein
MYNNAKCCVEHSDAVYQFRQCVAATASDIQAMSAVSNAELARCSHVLTAYILINITAYCRAFHAVAVRRQRESELSRGHHAQRCRVRRAAS